MKRILSLILCLILAFSLFACNDQNPDDQGGTDGTAEAKTYKVCVLDQNGDAVVGAKVNFYGQKDGNEYFGRAVVVNENGEAEDTLDTVYGVEIRLPDGYEELPTDENDYHAVFAEGEHTVTVTATKIASGDVTYTVTVVDESGNALSGVGVQLCHNVCLEAIATDNDGKMSATFTPSAKVKIKLISLPDGYHIDTIDDDGYHAYFADGETEITVVVYAD